jgi:hypothetical protein
MARPQIADKGVGLQISRMAANIFNKQSRTADMRWSSTSGLGREATHSSTLKRKLVTKCRKGPGTETDSLNKRPKLRKMDMSFCTWNVRSLHRAG